VAKPDLGTKRTCPGCSAKYYDLAKDPIVCPKCETVFEIAPPASSARSAPKAKPKSEPAPEPKVEETAKKDDDDADEPETISLEDADAEQSGEDIPELEDDDLASDVKPSEDEFLEEDDDSDDVSDIVVVEDDSKES